ncbi:hypothetical protein ABH935_009271 [Catenulispora sp. GAS73]|uniref:hypothetical protein n=1 Tax=Catenulispora sp. GAS73 TaxID=3156269 RepID=UPI003516428C
MHLLTEFGTGYHFVPETRAACGCVTLAGSDQELVAADGLYAELYGLQQQAYR